ncbi:DNA cytosine methyltransferase [Streptomyces sp. VNUA116]|uniref:DNA cytosine methyltransferase n=1 Tax=Streptomyces sp. VNUA116 TaxID=3062449 RepID=UPI00267670F5|nr:DNA cytosine methyltransferase [Streptomyces sp. VNUA116]WKU46770.1 DNA cytosine methyltransferase [Streptomyces sp. VNUA116]
MSPGSTLADVADRSLEAEVDLDSLSPAELEQLAAPYPVRWLYPPKPGEPDRVVYLFAGAGGLEIGIRDVLGHDLDIIGIEINKDASATATAAGLQRITADVTTLNPFHIALRWTRGLIVTAPCQGWTLAGKRAGLNPVNQQVILDMFISAWEATVGVWEDLDCSEELECTDDCDGCHEGWTGPIYGIDEVRAMSSQLTDERLGLIVEIVIWGLALGAQSSHFRWMAMEQSSALPEIIVEGIREEFKCGDEWLDTGYQVLDAVNYGLASRRKRNFWLASRYGFIDWRRLTPDREIPTTTAAEALGWPEGIRVNTRGVRKTQGGNCWSADKPAIAITSKIRGWYPEHDPEYRFTLDEAALLNGFRPGYPWTGSRTSACQQIGDVVAPPMGAVVVGALLKKPWEDQLRAYLDEIYPRTGTVTGDRSVITPAERSHRCTTTRRHTRLSRFRPRGTRSSAVRRTGSPSRGVAAKPAFTSVSSSPTSGQATRSRGTATVRGAAPKSSCARCWSTTQPRTAQPASSCPPSTREPSTGGRPSKCEAATETSSNMTPDNREALPRRPEMKEGTMNSQVETEYGTVAVRRVEPDGVPEDERAWTASYEVTGPRIKGLVHVQPQFRRDREGFELLPSEVEVHMASDRYSTRRSNFTVNGVELDGAHLLHITSPEDANNHYFRRQSEDFRRTELSDAGQARAQAGLRAVLKAHYADPLLMHDHATALAKFRSRSRHVATLRELEKRIAEAEELEQVIEGLRNRLGLLGDLDLLAAAQRPAEPEPEPEESAEPLAPVVELDAVPEAEEVLISELRAGDRVYVVGNNTLGRTIRREGVLLAHPKMVIAQDWGRRVKKWRLYVDDEPGAEPARYNSVTLWPDAMVERVRDRENYPVDLAAAA